MTVTLYEYAGGTDAMRRLAQAHYDRCVSDPLLVQVFGTTPRPEHVEHLAVWLGEVFGGPSGYTDRYGGHHALLSHHAGLGINEAQRVAFVEAFMAAADEAGLPADALFRSRLYEYVEWGTRIAHSVSQHPTVGPSDDPVPLWDWGPDGPPSK
ncbi:group II truncated hemoglobin [Tenggerimyces flavus]|uniref:Group II truncated hemoglobin n=1 Tax=Tenggerimyces flavus TaxID=1708749 RepID=A0ABV7YMZ2_9ACTN|nr:group II truncated hemoglobin [Tenggerimyces flavus]MBM7784866.1 hemoglobin [Tenggerimyces flavus]